MFVIFARIFVVVRRNDTLTQTQRDLKETVLV